jgi:hypothetical protein
MNTTELRQRLSDHHSFLALAGAVSTDRSPASDEIRIVLNSVSEFLRTARDIRGRGKELEALLNHAVRAHEKVLPKKKSVREIAHDFRLLVTAEPDVWRFGIPHGWLLERFDVSGLPQAEDLPRHARVGIGVHAGQVSVEEVSLLEDTFFLLVRARKSFEAMMRCASSRSMETNPHEHLGDYRGLRMCLHSVGHTEIWATRPRLAQNAWKVPLSRASRNARMLSKPGDFQRSPARLKRL